MLLFLSVFVNEKLLILVLLTLELLQDFLHDQAKPTAAWKQRLPAELTKYKNVCWSDWETCCMGAVSEGQLRVCSSLKHQTELMSGPWVCWPLKHQLVCLVNGSESQNGPCVQEGKLNSSYIRGLATFASALWSLHRCPVFQTEGTRC